MKFSFKILSLSLLVFAILSSCTDPDVVTKAEESTFNKEGSIINVSGLNPTFFNLIEKETTAISFDMATAGASVSDSDLFISYNGGEDKLYKNINSFPASQTISLVEMADFFGTTLDAIGIGDAFKLKFISNTADGRYETSKNVTIKASCPSNLAGWYSTSTVYAAHDFLADYPMNSLDSLEVVEDEGGVYSVSDISGGLYSVGPYVAAYGTTGFPFVFTDVCNGLSWEEQVDPFSQEVQEVDGLSNTVDADTGVITISVFLATYGEQWTIVMTPL